MTTSRPEEPPHSKNPSKLMMSKNFYKLCEKLRYDELGKENAGEKDKAHGCGARARRNWRCRRIGFTFRDCPKHDDALRETRNCKNSRIWKFYQRNWWRGCEGSATE